MPSMSAHFALILSTFRYPLFNINFRYLQVNSEKSRYQVCFGRYNVELTKIYKNGITCNDE